MTDKERDEEQRVGHDSTTIPGGEKEMGDPGRTPSKAEGDRETVEEDLRQKGRD
ncbi:MAG: hypothetical protein ACJ74W_22290 [Pyrinomonadaceae bacterium]